MLKHEVEKLFFIIAPDRSGSSKLQEIMNTFPNFCNTKESRIYDSDNSPSCWDAVIRYRNYKDIEKFIEDNWTKEFFVEKSNPSINCISEIYDRFSNANFIFLERNPLKMILSQINLFHGMSQIGNREKDLIQTTQNSKYLIRERLLARRILKMIQSQVMHKTKFKRKLIIRFEDLVTSPESQVKKIGEYFGIEPNYKKVQECMSQPSYSTTYRYGVRELRDKEAIDMVKVACHLWEYDYNVLKEKKEFLKVKRN